MDEPTRTFDTLYDEHADAIFRHLYFRVGNRDRALDLAQEVFAGLWKQLADGKAVENPRAYLYRSAHNAFVNELKRAKKDLSLDRLADDGYEPADPTDVEAKAVQQEVIDKLSEVDEPYRTSLVLRYVDGFRVKDIAELLGEQENTVSVRIRRGTELLKKIYGPI